MNRELTIKQRRFWKAYLETGNLAQSAKEAGARGKSSQALSMAGRHLLQAINPSSRDLLDELGLTDQLLAKKLEEGLSATDVRIASEHGIITDERFYADHATRSRFLEMAHKLKGSFIDKKEVVGKSGGPILLKVVYEDVENGNGEGDNGGIEDSSSKT